MRDIIIIGERPAGTPVCGATMVSGHDCISKNSQAYWIFAVIGDLDLRVYAGCPEHAKLTALLEKQASRHKIDEFLIELVLRHITPHEFRVAYERDLEEARTEGADAKAREIRNALGI